ncbi:thiamine phosphate synthase [Psychrilyobacter atlanticus]|uniref:thiamine phosphate synthase n=1 Tax=Psychrilyobacter atlanticus TaxID=271091 RepID=UPI000424AE84|nr:thiamine phosphate synthase [Psychrilyobacter atlanticus]
MKKTKGTIPHGIYGITGEKFANGRSNIECVRSMIDGGIKIIQYREKEKSIKEKVEEIIEIRRLCLENNVIFIVNDHVDIAILVDADGVHVGQDDMEISHVRKLIGKDKIIGRSTHCLEHAKKAVADGADYIGVGPIFKTTTKEKDPVGLEYLEEVIKNIDLPFVAIGGIKESNVEEVKRLGAASICMVSEIVGAENIVEKIKKLNEIID